MLRERGDILNEKDLLTHFFHVWPHLNELLTSDVAVTLTDLEKFLFAKPGKTLDLKINAGDPLKPGSAVARAIQEKRRVVIRADKALFGVPYIAVAIPLYNQRGEVIGAASVQETVQRQDDLKQMSTTLTDNINVVASTIEEISAQTEEIAATSRTLTNTAKNSNARLRETDGVLSLIKSIVSQTNLLGLNAAIESARVGEHGRGFAVVAQEIRKLATTSTESIMKIEQIVNAIQVDSSRTCKEMEQIDDIISQISGAITHVAGAMQQTSELALKLDNLADNLSTEK